jgi:hypothetical protein
MRHRAGITLFLVLAVAAVASPAGKPVQIEGRAYEVVAETERLQLLLNQESVSIAVRDLKSGKLWTSFVPEAEPAYQATNRVWQRNMQSLFTFAIVSSRDERASKRQLSLVGPESTVQTKLIPGGVRWDVWFGADLKVGLSMEITIEGAALLVRIPPESIREESNIMLVSVTPLPFFGYTRSDDQGYMLVPDGCGALYHYKTTESGSQAIDKKVSWYTYAPEVVSFEEYRKLEDDLINPAYLPVFGVKLGNDAFVASVDQGDTNAYIHFYESGFAVDLNRMNVEFTIRHTYELFLSDITVQGALVNTNVAPIRYDPKRIPIERSVRYEFLSGEDATYAGMARQYRRHLLDTGVLTPAVPAGAIPLGVSLFGGIYEDRLLVDKFVTMTSFSEAAEILAKLLAKDVSSIQANYIGWTKYGYGKPPSIWPPSRGLGGAGGLRTLGGMIDGDAVTLYLQIDPVLAQPGDGRFSQRNDVVKQLTRLPVRDELKGTFLLNPQEAYERVADLVGKLKGYGIDGIAFEKLGDMLFQDYSRRAPSERNETLETWNKMASLSSEQLGSAALVRANIRQANSADLILDLPVETSGYVVIDEAIPFYQMILHGSVYYTTDPENLFYDTRRQLLQWIETGAIPYYMLTYRRSENLAFTEYNHLFTSFYEDWIDVAADRFKEFNREFGRFYHLDMVDHARLGKNVVRVTYADGSRIYLNYAEAPVTIEGVSIEGLGYRVVPAGTPTRSRQ